MNEPKSGMRKALGSRLEGLTPVRRELRALREAHDRLRDELLAEQERTREEQERTREAGKAHADELRRMTGAREKYRRERDQLAFELQSIQESQSFRVGHAIVLTARFPLKAARALAAFALRLARGFRRRVVAPSGRGIARAARATWAAIRSLPGRTRRLLGRLGRALKSAVPKKRQTPAPAAAAAQKPGASSPAAGADGANGAGGTEDERVISVPQGNQFLGPLTDGHATTMFLLWGLSDEELQSLVDEVARLQLMQWDFKPLFVTDSDNWESFQEHGYWFEYIPPAEDWIGHNDGGDWSQFVSERVDSIVETYTPDRIVVYEDADKRGALRRGVLNSVISAGDAVVETTTTAKLKPPGGGNGASAPRS